MNEEQRAEALNCLHRLERLLSSEGFRMEPEIAKIRRALSTTALLASCQEAEGIREAVEGFAEGMYIYGTTAEGHVRDVAHCFNIWRAYKRTSDFRERVDAVLAILSIPKGEPQEDTHHD